MCDCGGGSGTLYTVMVEGMCDCGGGLEHCTL